LLKHTTEINKVLIDRCKKGDRQAQYELYSSYAKAMDNVCVRIVNNTADAEDILQESFVEAFDKLSTFRNESTIGAWIRRIVVNRSVNYLKKRKLVLMESLPDTAYADNETNNEEAGWDVSRINAAISDLPDGYRVVLSLYLLEGYDHGEIGTILNITEATSKSQYSSAKKRLLEILRTKASG
jgi:RNA polymerase sigma-70 factor (ECF subfamily)